MSIPSLLLTVVFHLLLRPPPTAARTAASDVAALAAFKAAIAPSSINPWSCVASWNFSSDPCRPLVPSHFTCGLGCSADATRITSVFLDAAGYSGTLPPLLAALTALSHLDLTDNSFHGAIPPSLFSSLSSLQTLVLSSNSFSGAVPSSISALVSLQTLDLSRNAFSGLIPDLPPNLITLDLSSNRLAGPIPKTLPPNLITLSLRGNSLSGFLSKSTFQPLRWLEIVELGANRLSGKLEGWFFLLPSIQQVDLANNSFSGLEVWKAGEGAGDRLVAVELSFNRIKGVLPAELAGFPALASLSARYNGLRGGIPWQYYGAKRGVAFRRLFLDGNFLNGRVPDGFLGGGSGDQVAGSFGDNCLEGCRGSAALCSPVQKPDSVCREVYRDRRSPRRPSPATGGV